ncbi:MAG TPA: Smr/MutS family protein [Candidatus Sulfotelmatobacter sp.]|nr:Smr/MutS family protein [Candidatus Sulfotelmatobacter sp.]
MRKHASRLRSSRATSSIKVCNLKADMPPVPEALQRLERELGGARQEGAGVLKIVHGYGSHGVGGDIRVAVQKRLFELAGEGKIAGYIFGENWEISHDLTWKLLQTHPELKQDADLGRRNEGISIVLLRR